MKPTRKANLLKFTGFVTGLTILFSSTPASAEDLNTRLQQQQSQANSLQNEMKTIQSEISTLNSQIAEKQSEIDEMKNKIEETTNKIEKLKSEIEALQVEIEEAKKVIAEKEEEIARLEAQQERRLEILRERAATLQKQDRTNIFIDVILNSTSIVDLMQRVTSLGTLFQSDTDIMQELQETQVIIEAEKEIVEEKARELAEQQATLQQRQDDLQKEQDALQQQERELQQQQDSLQASQSQKEASLKRLEDNLSAVRNDIATTNAQLEEQAAAAARLLAEQRAAREAAERASAEKQAMVVEESTPTESTNSASSTNNNNSSLLGNNSSNNNSGNSGSTGQFNGRFVSPVNGGRITSPFGPRRHPVTGVQSFHRGIDIVSSTPNAPIHAIAAGTVVFSGWASGYGNYIVIQHDATTFSGYGHNRTNQVRVGDRVSAGQQIAIMGTTGVSTGVHLHLNIMKNTTNFWSGHVNPAPLLGM